MIGVVNYPNDLAEWDAESEEQPFYFELYGETKPRITMDIEQVIPVGQRDSSPQAVAPLPIYEYSWTIGHSGASHLDSLWSQLQEPAAKIFLYFPISRGWRVKELIATVKYLTPVPQQEEWLQKISQLSQDVSPFISEVSSLIRMVPGAPFTEIASILSTIARLQINNVPRVEGFEWSVQKVSHKSEYGVMQGIEWTIPRNLFQLLGTRLTGSVAVSFIPSLSQQNYNIYDDKQQPLFQQGTLLARAEIHPKDKDKSPFFVPPAQEGQPEKYVELQIGPVIS